MIQKLALFFYILTFPLFLSSQVICADTNRSGTNVSPLSTRTPKGQHRGVKSAPRPIGLLPQPWTQACKIDNKLVFLSNERDEDTVTGRIRKLSVFYNKNEISKIRDDINVCQNHIDGQITQIKIGISTLVSYKQSLLQNGDIHQIAKQIAQNYKSKDSIREELRMNLTGVSFKGLFLAVIRYKSPFESKRNLAEIAKNLIAKKAVKDLNGVFLKSFTSEKEGVLVKDYIESKISGEMAVAKTYLSKTNPANRIYIYLSKMAVSPLKTGVDQNRRRKGEGYEKMVFHLGHEDFDEKLRLFGLPRDQINLVARKVETFQPNVVTENKRESMREQQAIRVTLKKLNDIDKKMADLHREIEDKRRALKMTFDSIGFSCQEIDKPEGCINDAIAQIDQRIEADKKRLLSIKENELIFKESSVLAESDPARDIAKQAIGLLQQMVSNYSTVEKLLERTEVEDGVLSDYQMERDVSIIRHLDRFWVFVVPKMEDSFGLMIVAKFKIKDQKEAKFVDSFPKARGNNIHKKKLVQHRAATSTPLTKTHVKENRERGTEGLSREKRFSPEEPKVSRLPQPSRKISKIGTSLRSRPERLSHEDVQTMLSRFGFFDRKRNRSGNFQNKFVDNGDGTVTDTSTGLMWQKEEPMFEIKHSEVNGHIAQLNSQGSSGYSDWRLPTLEELASLMVRRRDTTSESTNDLADTGEMSAHQTREPSYLDPVFDRESMNICWSADSFSSEKSWAARFWDGYLDVYTHSWYLSVKAVRTIE